MYKYLFKRILFCLSPEKAHNAVFSLLKIVFKIPFVASIFRAIYQYQDPRLVREVCGIKFPNPIGLAAGLDKNANWINILPDFGFGFIEVGTVTPKAQSGNLRPRLFRLPKDEALINRMGFNNKGVTAMVKQLKKKKKGIIIGGNIGKNKVTDNQNAINDYIFCFRELFDHVDYFTINVSSPNTPGLRELQDKEPLSKLLSQIQIINYEQAKPKPIFLKIAPDVNNDQLDDIIDVVNSTRIHGIIACNTSLSREQLNTDPLKINTIGAGGLSGRPIKNRSTEIIRYIHQKTNGKLPIIGVGGIHSAEDALEKLAAGASLVQIYTGFVYEGPGLIKKICKKLIRS